jgi:hypothetical protein
MTNLWTEQEDQEIRKEINRFFFGLNLFKWKVRKRTPKSLGGKAPSILPKSKKNPSLGLTAKNLEEWEKQSTPKEIAPK